MVWIEENNISSGIDGFLWRAMESNASYKQILFLQKYRAINLTKLSTLKNIEPIKQGGLKCQKN